MYIIAAATLMLYPKEMLLACIQTVYNMVDTIIKPKEPMALCRSSSTRVGPSAVDINWM